MEGTERDVTKKLQLKYGDYPLRVQCVFVFAL